MIHPDGTISTTQYTQNTTISTAIHIDAKGHKREEDRDAYGRLKEVREYTGNASSCTSGQTGCGTYEFYARTKYAYDVLGNLTYVTHPAVTQSDGTLMQIAPTIITYDELGRKTQIQDPDMGVWKYTRYNAHGNFEYWV